MTAKIKSLTIIFFQEGIHEENDLEAYEENSQCASEVPNSKSSEDQSSLPLNNNTLHRSRVCCTF